MIPPGSVRVDAITNSSNLRVSAYLQSANELYVVVINVSPTTTESTAFTFKNWANSENVVVIQTSSKTNATVVGNYTFGSIINFPPYSVSTLMLSKQSVLDKVLSGNIETIITNAKVDSQPPSTPPKQEKPAKQSRLENGRVRRTHPEHRRSRNRTP